jgi:tetratricopeptide (TPR) repeat protein
LTARLIIALLLFSMVGIGIARAEIESPQVKQGLAAAAQLDYARAIILLEQARKESLTREEKIATYAALGNAYAALGNGADARAHFERLLRIDPSHELDRSVAPKVRAIFEDAKAQVATAARGPDLALARVQPETTPAQPREGQPLTVSVSYGGGMAQKLALYHRTAGQTAFSRLTSDGQAGRFTATVPGAQVQSPAFEYHLSLLDGAGAAVAGAGSLGRPLVIPIARVKRPLYKRAWFWGVLGGTLAAAGAATALALTLPQSSNATITVTAQ